VGNFRTTVDTLRQEKQALLEIQQGGEGEKSQILASSQKALERAAHLVADAAALREREAKFIIDDLENRLYRHLSVRLETLIPPPVAGSEIAAIKGELLTAKVIGKASKALDGIATVFAKAIRPALPTDTSSEIETDESLHLIDETKQEIATMFHQSKFAEVVVNASSHLIRYLVASQWPDLLDAEQSADLGVILGHSVGGLDATIEEVLKTLKQEGTLTREQASVEAFEQIVNSTLQAIQVEVSREDSALLSSDWNPTGWGLLKDASTAKFLCLGATAALSLAFHERADRGLSPSLAKMYNSAEQIASQANSVVHLLASLDVSNTKLSSDLAVEVSGWLKQASEYAAAMQAHLNDQIGFKLFMPQVDLTLKSVSRLSFTLRSSSLSSNDGVAFHSMSPEVDDPWDQTARLAKAVRGVDGDDDDLNYLLRARAIEQHIHAAILNEPKLEAATSKITTLEKVSYSSAYIASSCFVSSNILLR
jgi:dynactin 1